MNKAKRIKREGQRTQRDSYVPFFEGSKNRDKDISSVIARQNRLVKEIAVLSKRANLKEEDFMGNEFETPMDQDPMFDEDYVDMDTAMSQAGTIVDPDEFETPIGQYAGVEPVGGMNSYFESEDEEDESEEESEDLEEADEDSDEEDESEDLEEEDEGDSESDDELDELDESEELPDENDEADDQLEEMDDSEDEELDSISEEDEEDSEDELEEADEDADEEIDSKEELDEEDEEDSDADEDDLDSIEEGDGDPARFTGEGDEQ